MSYVEIYKIDKDGYSFFCDKIENSWLHGMRVWQLLENKYLPQYIPPHILDEVQKLYNGSSKKYKWLKKRYKNFEDFKKNITKEDIFILCSGYIPTRCNSMLDRDAMQDIWGLFDDKEVGIHDRICLWTTFDYSVLRREDIPVIIEAMQNFIDKEVFFSQIEILERLYKDETCMAVAWNLTSINSSYWSPCYDTCDENETPFNLFDKMKENESIEFFDMSILD